VLVIYGLSSWFVHEQILTRKQHNDLWNIILLTCFLIAAGLGVLLAVNIRYGLEIQFIEQVTGIHVEAGIVLFLVALLHILARRSHFYSILRARVVEKEDPAGRHPETQNSPGEEGLQAFILGLTSIITQLLLLRQFLDFFGGNELVIGLILAVWMLFTALGTWAGSRLSRRPYSYRRLFIILGGLPFITLSLSYPIKHFLFSYGVQTGPWEILLFTSILLPFCSVSGLLFSMLTGTNVTVNPHRPVNVYSMEAVGFAVGGILFTLFAYASFPGLSLAAILFPLNHWLVNRKKYHTAKKRFLKSKLVFSLIAVTAIILYNPDRFFAGILYPGQELLKTLETPWGRLSLVRNNGQISSFSGGIPLYSEGNEVGCEEIIHYSLIQSSHVDRILLISGDPQCLGSEITQYNAKEIVYFSTNPWLLNFLPDSLSVPRTGSFHTPEMDIVQFLSTDTSHFDAVLLSLPAPSTVYLNKYYADEFIGMLKERLNPQGIITWTLPTAMNYQSTTALVLNSCLYTGIRKHFNGILLIPGTQLYFIAGDSALTSSIAAEIDRRNIKADYVNSWYIDDVLMQLRIDEAEAGIRKDSGINSLWHPVGYYNSLHLWLDQHRAGFIFLVVALLFLVLPFLVLRTKAIPGIYVIGFVAASLEYLVMVGYQLAFGDLAASSGVLISVYMFGTAMGATVTQKLTRTPNWWNAGLALGILLSVLIPFVLLNMNIFTVHRLLLFTGFLLLQLLVAIYAGAMYTLAVNLVTGSEQIHPAKLYSADLLGATTGMLTVSILAFPLSGLTTTGFLVAGLILLFFIKSILIK
jgi:spermidine synthase